jgi:DNA ligase D-like protein (predicted ligase)
MKDLFDDKNINPMLIAEQREPFNSKEFIYEMKFDGIRCIAYMSDSTDIRTKRDVNIISKFPELVSLHEQVSHKCILDGELVVLKDGVPDFYEIQRRILMTDTFKIQLASSKLPASLIVYDILYYKDKDVLSMPLMDRKELLCSIVKENNRLILSRHIEEHGIQLFEAVREKKLEGIVAKKKDSRYEVGKRSKSWVKCKVLNEIDAVVCGYIRKKDGITSIIIGQYNGTKLMYKAHVSLGAGMRHLRKYGYEQISEPPFGYSPSGHENAVWIKPDIVCTIEYMPDERANMRLAVFKCIRDDKSPYECQVENEV